MGSLCSRRKKEKVKNTILEEELAAKPQPYVIPALVKRQKIEKVELTFRSQFASREEEVKSYQYINEILRSQKWIISKTLGDALIKDFEDINILEWIEKSPAIALQITLKQSESSLICNIDKLDERRSKWDSIEDQREKNAIIYADLFKIKFLNLKKITINSVPKEFGDRLHSLEPLALLEAPFLEELSANGHPITNASFLRRCHWPFLSHVSLRDNAIIDSITLGKVLSELSNVSHLEGLNLSGIYSEFWPNVSWILKLGFCDAELQTLKLEEDPEYRERYIGKTLSRVDCNLSKNRLVNQQVRMICRKFNNSYFENPICLW